MVTLSIAQTWDGRPLPPRAHASVRLSRAGDVLAVEVAAPLYGDAPPPSPPGVTARLWEHEVVELFIAGPDARYVELELGPHGHHLALVLEGVRQPVASGLPVDYAVERRADDRFVGRARLSAAHLPAGPLRANAYAIHAQPCLGGPGRCHHAHAAVPGERPDFHQLARFVPISL